MISALFRIVGPGALRGVMSAATLIGVLLLGIDGGSRGQGDFTVGIAVVRADLADQHYKRALIFYENKDYPRAIREFQTAYKIRQLPRILLNIGQVYRKLGMASTALKFYEHYLRVDPQPKPEIKGEVDRYIAQTRAMLDPPDIVPLPSKSAAAAAAEAVAAAPSDVTPVTVPEYYADSEPPVVQVGPGGKGAVGGRGPGRGRGQPFPAVVDRQSPNLNLPGWQTRPLGGPPATAGNAVLGSPLVTPLPPPKPFYKKGWFWGVIGGVAAGVVITGVAVGVTQKSTVPGTILYPTK